MARGLHAVHLRHADVEERDVDPLAVHDLERFAAVTRLVDDRERELGAAFVEQVAQPRARRRLVVDDEDARGGAPGKHQVAAVM